MFLFCQPHPPTNKKLAPENETRGLLGRHTHLQNDFLSLPLRKYNVQYTTFYQCYWCPQSSQLKLEFVKSCDLKCLFNYH